MKLFHILLLSVLLPYNLSFAEDKGYDVFVPIAKYIRCGDADKLSSWFADNLEIAIVSKPCDSSRDQARQIVKTLEIHGDDIRKLRAGLLQDPAAEN